jgi:hypothetical protein
MSKADLDLPPRKQVNLPNNNFNTFNSNNSTNTVIEAPSNNEATSYKPETREFLESLAKDQTIDSSASPLSDTENPTKSNLENITNKQELDENGKNIYENAFFRKIADTVNPLVKSLNKGNRPVLISVLGASMHILDAVAESLKLPEPLRKLTYFASTNYSKFITHLPNTLTMFEDFAQNNPAFGIAKSFNLTKILQTEAANFSMSSGVVPGMLMARKHIGTEKYNARKFTSFGDNLKYTFNEWMGANKGSINDIKNGKDPVGNLLKLFTAPALITSSAIGCIALKDEVNTPKAKFVGFFRNFGGASGDALLIQEAVKDIKEKHGKFDLKEFFKHPDVKIGLPYIVASVSEMMNRETKDLNKLRIIAQGILGANETITAMWTKQAQAEAQPA